MSKGNASAGLGIVAVMALASAALAADAFTVLPASEMSSVVLRGDEPYPWEKKLLSDEVKDKIVESMILRDAGYDGVMPASNWQAGMGPGHYYNLHTDYQFGLIDRHNYFGGGSSQVINNATMLRIPGSGSFSAGMQQVADRPFMLSEWIHVTPNEWSVEGPAILDAYAMGLQGWDVSYIFQNRDEGKIGFTDSYQDTPQFDLSPYVKDSVYSSSTGQLQWHEGKTKLDGFFTIVLKPSGSSAVLILSSASKMAYLSAIRHRPRSDALL
jgi:hypothetical protein